MVRRAMRDQRIPIGERQIDVRIRGRILRQAAVLHLADDADDRHPGVARRQRTELHALADRVLSRPEPLDDAFADDRPPATWGDLRVVERPARCQRDAERAEEVRRHPVDVCARHVLRVDRRLAFGGVERRAAVAVERQIVGRASRRRRPGSARSRSSKHAAFDDRTRRRRRRCRSSRGNAARRGGAEVLGMLTCSVRTDCGSKPGFSAARLRTERIIRPAPTSRTTASDTSAMTSALRTRCDRRPPLPSRRFLQRAAQVEALRLQARHEADEDPQASETAMVNARDARSRSGRDKAGKRHRALRDQRGNRDAREHQPGRRAEHRQHAAFGDQLSEQAAAPCAERRAHGDFAPARFGSRDQQVGDVGAGDEQDEGDRRHQREQRGTQVAEQLDVERAHLDRRASRWCSDTPVRAAAKSRPCRFARPPGSRPA